MKISGNTMKIVGNAKKITGMMIISAAATSNLPAEK